MKSCSLTQTLLCQGHAEEELLWYAFFNVSPYTSDITPKRAYILILNFNRRLQISQTSVSEHECAVEAEGV